MKKALLALEDGTVLEGKGIGAKGISQGELVFTTTFTGYEESLTDPSYKGQNLMFTYPLIGNYGIQKLSAQSSSIKAEGIVVKEACSNPEHRDSRETIGEFLENHGSRGIAGIDTRELTLKIRSRGTIKSAISVGDYRKNEILEKAKNQPEISEKQLIPQVTSEKIRTSKGKGPKLAVIDTGMKESILSNLERKGFETIIFPSETSPETIKKHDPDGLLLTNGPGDPKNAKKPQGTVSEFSGKIPIFGICLGAQIISLALGGETYKLKFGHRGANQPVKNHETGVVGITSQNHGFAIEKDSLKGTGLEVTETNAIDGTVEAIQSEKPEIFAVQYHPEASPGPKDKEEWFFEKILKMTGGENDKT